MLTSPTETDEPIEVPFGVDSWRPSWTLIKGGRCILAPPGEHDWGGDSSLCQITLTTTCCSFYRTLFVCELASRLSLVITASVGGNKPMLIHLTYFIRLTQWYAEKDNALSYAVADFFYRNLFPAYVNGAIICSFAQRARKSKNPVALRSRYTVTVIS